MIATRTREKIQIFDLKISTAQWANVVVILAVNITKRNVQLFQSRHNLLLVQKRRRRVLAIAAASTSPLSFHLSPCCLSLSRKQSLSLFTSTSRATNGAVRAVGVVCLGGLGWLCTYMVGPCRSSRRRNYYSLLLL